MGGPENQLSSVVAVTPASVVRERPKASFSKEAFDSLIVQKGYPVFIDKTVKCPCAIVYNGQAQPGCRNCGGTGYVTYNRRDTHAILHSMNRDTKFKEWSQELLGTASLTTYHEIYLSYMDKITLQEGVSTHNEIRSIKQYADDNIYRTGLMYPPIFIEAVFLFTTKGDKLTILNQGVDFILTGGNVLEFLPPSGVEAIQNPTISIRYRHRPQFMVIDIPRKTMNSLSRDPNSNIEGGLQYPIHAILRTAHYVLNVDSNDGEYILDNSFTEQCSGKVICINGTSLNVRIYEQSEINVLDKYKGLIIFNNTTNTYQGWNGTEWVLFGPDNFWDVAAW